MRTPLNLLDLSFNSSMETAPLQSTHQRQISVQITRDNARTLVTLLWKSKM